MGKTGDFPDLRNKHKEIFISEHFVHMAGEPDLRTLVNQDYGLSHFAHNA